MKFWQDHASYPFKSHDTWFLTEDIRWGKFEASTDIKPALVSIEDGWQVGYLLEPLHDGWVAVFLPQAPTPMSGNVMYFPSARVRPLEMTMVQAMTLIKRIGIGSAQALRGSDLSQPVS